MTQSAREALASFKERMLEAVKEMRAGTYVVPKPKPFRQQMLEVARGVRDGTCTASERPVRSDYSSLKGGDRIGSLTAVKELAWVKNRRWRWRCSCGYEFDCKVGRVAWMVRTSGDAKCKQCFARQGDG